MRLSTSSAGTASSAIVIVPEMVRVTRRRSGSLVTIWAVCLYGPVLSFGFQVTLTLVDSPGPTRLRSSLPTVQRHEVLPTVSRKGALAVVCENEIVAAGRRDVERAKVVLGLGDADLGQRTVGRSNRRHGGVLVALVEGGVPSGLLDPPRRAADADRQAQQNRQQDAEGLFIARVPSHASQAATRRVPNASGGRFA